MVATKVALVDADWSGRKFV